MKHMRRWCILPFCLSMSISLRPWSLSSSVMGSVVCVVSGGNTHACMHHNFILSLLVFPQQILASLAPWQHSPQHRFIDARPNTFPIAANRCAFDARILWIRYLLSPLSVCLSVCLAAHCECIAINGDVDAEQIKLCECVKYKIHLNHLIERERVVRNMFYQMKNM